MERTRIVHYTHSPTPVVISPSTTKPRLSSSSSLSSLVSCVDEKAPLASIDPENPSRRSSKSSDRSSRSSSTGRLFDNAKLGTSVYTAVRCQDYPIQPSTPTLRRDRGGNGRSDRPASTLPGNGKPPIGAHDENRRHTLGSWSRSRRKPQQNDSPNSSFNRKGSATLPRKPENLDTVSSSTLVKPRKRYTWLSPKQVAPQGSTSPAPLKEHNINGEVEKRRTSPRVSEILTGNLRTNNVSPASSPGSPRLNLINFEPKPGSPNFNISKPDSIPGSPKLNSPASIPGSPRLNLSTKPVSIPGSPRLNSSNRVSVGNSSTLDPRFQADEYNWKKDPRRKPCHIQDAFDISPPSTPPQSELMSKLGSKGVSFHANGSVNSDTGYSSSSTSESHPLHTILQHNPKINQEGYFSNTAITEGQSNGNRNIFSHSPNVSIYSVTDDSFHISEDKTPVKDISNDEYTESFPSSTSRELPSSVTPTASNNGSADTLLTEDKNDEHSLPNHEIDSNGIKYSWSKVGKDTFILSRKGSDASNRSGRSSASGKTPSSSSGNSPSITDDTATCFASPRNRSSFRMAVGRYDSWCEITPHGGSISNFLENGRGSVGSDTVFPIQESALPSEEYATRGGEKSREDDIFVSCDDLLSSKCKDDCNAKTVDVSNSVKPHTLPSVVNSPELTSNQNEKVCDPNDSPGRRIKRYSMRLATASLSDLTCSFEDIDIGENTTPTNQDSSQKPLTGSEIPNNASSSPLSIRTNLSRTGSLLSSRNSSSLGSYYSCQSAGNPSNKNSPVSSGSRRNELRAKLDSPSVSRHSKTSSGSAVAEKPSNNSLYARLATSRASSPAVSTTSSSRSSHRQRPTYYWTRQAPYPRLLFSSCISGASSKTSSCHAPSSPQPSTTSSIYSNFSYNHKHPQNGKTIPYFTKDKQQQQQPRTNTTSNSKDVPFSFRQQEPKSNSSSRPMTLPLHTTHFTHRDSQYYDYNAYDLSSDLTPTSIIESPNSEAIRSPPSLGRPKRKQYAGFDSQPLPMDSFMSDSSSVYTGVSCSSRNTDMTGQPDNVQFDESFVSEADVQSNFDGEIRGDFSFDGSESFRSRHEIHDTSSHEPEESDSKRNSIHSTSTTKGNSDEENEHENGSFHDDFIESSQDCINPKYSKFGQQFGPEYDAIFRLYKSDDVIRQDDLFTPPPPYRLWSESGKALSSSCLLRSKFYSKRKFLSTRDIFDLMRNSDRAGLDATVSLTSLELHAHKVCEAILRCDEMGQGRQRHSLV